MKERTPFSYHITRCLDADLGRENAEASPRQGTRCPNRTECDRADDLSGNSSPLSTPQYSILMFTKARRAPPCMSLALSVLYVCLVPLIFSRRTFASASHEPTAGGICSHYVVYPTAKMSQIPPSRCGHHKNITRLFTLTTLL